MNRITLLAGMLIVALSFPSSFSLSESLNSDDDLQGILLWTDVPRDTTTGQSIILTVEIENARSEKDFHLECIDVTERFMRGFSLLKVNPAPDAQDLDDGDLTLEYSILIPAQSSMMFYIELEAIGVGVFFGDVDIWGSEEEENGDFITTRIQSKVE